MFLFLFCIKGFSVLLPEKYCNKLTAQQLVYTANNHDHYENSVEPHRKRIMTNERNQMKMRIHIMALSRKTSYEQGPGESKK